MDIALIDDLRKRKKLTQAQFAEMIDFTTTGYQKMLANGDVKVSTLEKICEVFNVDILTFFGKTNKPALSIVAEESEVYGVTNYKEKYFETLEKLNACNERLLGFTDLKKGSIKK